MAMPIPNQTAGRAAGATATPTAKAPPPVAGAEPDVPALLEPLPRGRLEAMLAAGREIRECCRVLGKVRANVVGEILRDQGPFYEHRHYPKGDVFDAETFSQYYYHAHRAGSGEHGHFHTFLRAGGMPEGARPVPHAGEAAWPAGDGALSHLVASGKVVGIRRP